MKDSEIVTSGINPMDGFTPSVPVGKSLDFGSEEFQQLEGQGNISLDKRDSE